MFVHNDTGSATKYVTLEEAGGQEFVAVCDRGRGRTEHCVVKVPFYFV